MALIYKLPEIPAVGLKLDQVVESDDLDLSADEGKIIGGLSCTGILSKLDEGSVYFQGQLSGKIARECVRCLGVFEEFLSLPCTALFKKPSGGESFSRSGNRWKVNNEEILEEGEEVYPILQNQIDLLPIVRETIILATPIQVLCQDECQGLCQTCGGNLNMDVCTCGTPVLASEGVFHGDPLPGGRKRFHLPAGRRRLRSTKTQ